LEGTLQITFHPPCHGQGHLPLDQVAQSPVQPDLEVRENLLGSSQGDWVASEDLAVFCGYARTKPRLEPLPVRETWSH